MKLSEQFKNRVSQLKVTPEVKKTCLAIDWENEAKQARELLKPFLFSMAEDSKEEPIGIVDIRLDDLNDDCGVVHLQFDVTNNLGDAFDNGSYYCGYDTEIELKPFFERNSLLNENGDPALEENDLGEIRNIFLYLFIDLLIEGAAAGTLGDFERLEPWYIEVGFYSGADPDILFDSSGRIKSM
ncbi:MAG: hypothetical protein GY754_40310 [bacterium]|nr:hypothetical protein [bacterium]